MQAGQEARTNDLGVIWCLCEGLLTLLVGLPAIGVLVCDDRPHIANAEYEVCLQRATPLSAMKTVPDSVARWACFAIPVESSQAKVKWKFYLTEHAQPWNCPLNQPELHAQMSVSQASP